MSEKDIGDIIATVITGEAGLVTLSTTEEVRVRVCDGNALPLLLNFAARVSSDLGLSLKDPTAIKDKLLSKVDDVGFILNLISKYTSDVYTLVGSMSSLKTPDAVAALAVDDLIKVTTRVVEVNAYFFIKRVLPMLPRQMLEGL